MAFVAINQEGKKYETKNTAPKGSFVAINDAGKKYETKSVAQTSAPTLDPLVQAMTSSPSRLVQQATNTTPTYTSRMVQQATEPITSGGWKTNRATDTLEGAAKSTASSFVNLGGLLADTVGSTIDAFERNPGEYAQKRVEEYTKMLERGTLDNGTPLTPKMRQDLQAAIEKYSAEAAEKTLTNTYEERHPVLQNVESTLYNTADTMAEDAQTRIDRAKEGLGAGGQLLVDATVAGSQLAGDIAIAAATGGSAIPAMFARSVGGSAQEARHAGADTKNQLAYGIGSGLASVATEKVLNVAAPFAKAFGGGVLDKAVGKAMEELGQSAMGKIALSALSEGGEEYLEALIQPVLQRATYDESAKFDKDGALTSILVGAILGGISGTAEVINAKPRNRLQQSSASLTASSEGSNAPEVKAPQNASESVSEAVAEPAKKPTFNNELLRTAEVMQAENGRPSNSVVEAITKAPEALQELGVDPSGKTASQLRAEVRQRIEQAVVGEEIEVETAVEEAPAKTSVDDTITREAQRLFAPEAPVQKVENNISAEAAPTATATESVGAAPAGFSPFTDLQGMTDKYYPEGANAARPADMPMYDAEGKRISQFASNLVGAQGLTDEGVRIVEKLVVDGLMSADVLTNKTSLNNAVTQINSMGVDGAMTHLRELASRGETSPQAVAMLEVLIMDSENSGNYERSAELFTLGGELARASGRSTQMFAALRKMDPKYQAYAITKTVAEAEQAVKTGKQKAVDEKAIDAQNDAVNAAIDQRDTAIGIIQTLIDAYTGGEEAGWNLQSVIDNLPNGSSAKAYLERIDRYIKSEKDAGWVPTLAHELASKAESRAKDTTAKQKTIYETISGDLSAFMMQHVDDHRGKAPKRTAADRLADYFANKQEYSRAWNDARNALRKKYKNDPKMMDRLEAFLNSPIMYNGESADTVMLRAVTDAALANDLDIKDLTLQNKYDADALVNQIADTLIKQTGAKGSDEIVIRDAVKRHVNETVLEANKKADKYIDTDIKKTMKDMGEKISDVMKTGAENKAALAKKISDTLISQYGISKQGAEAASKDIVGQFDAMLKASAQEYLDARFGDKKPKGIKTFDQKLTELANMGAFADPKYREKASASLIGENAASVTNTAEWKTLTDKFVAAKTDAERNNVIGEMQQYVADNMERTLGDKFADWVATTRYMNMLGNIKTPLRNTIGNLVNRAVVEADNAIITFAERVAGDKLDNTRSVFVNKSLMDVGRADAQVMMPQLQGGGGKYAEGRSSFNKNDFMRGVKERQKVFGDIFGLKNPLQIGRDTIDWIMNNKIFGDEAFLRNAYARYLGGYLQANGVSAKQWNDPAWQKANTGFIEKARTTAVDLAKEATFRQDSAFSEWMSKAGRRPGTPWYVRAAAEGLMPFRKTPANVFVEIVEHSPIGLVETTIKAAQKALKSVDADGNPKVTGTDILESLAKNVSGTALLGLGFALAKMGVLRGGPSDDKDQAAFDELVGHQDYAIELDNGKSFTIDWLTPSATPVVIGAEMYRRLQNNGSRADAVLSALTAMSDPMLEQSFVSGLKDAVEQARYSEDAFGEIVLSTMINYVVQMMTSTLGGQMERAFHKDSMMTYVDKNKETPEFIQKTLGKISAKVPGWDYNQVPYINAWGERETTEDPELRAFHNLINPGYSSKVEMDHVETEIQKLIDAGAKASIVTPERAGKDFDVRTKVKNPKPGEDEYVTENKKLTAEQYVKYATAKGQNSHKYVKQAVDSKAFKSLGLDEKEECLSKIYGYANYKAQKSLFPAHTSDTYAKYEEAEKKGISPVEFYAYKEGIADLEADKDRNGNSISGSLKEKTIDAIAEMDFLTPAEKDWVYLLSYSSKDEKKNKQNLRRLPWNK